MDTNEKLPVWRKICFAMGGACFTTTHTVISFFISIFLLEVAQIRPLHVSVILVTGKVWDAITDPVCGYMANKTSTRIGRLRPWIVFSAPFACGAYFCMWYVPEVTYNAKFAWYILFYCLCKGFVTATYVPYSSLTMAISDDQKERDSATAYRLAAEAAGTLIAVVVQGQIVGEYRRAGTCGSAGTALVQTVSRGEVHYIDWPLYWKLNFGGHCDHRSPLFLKVMNAVVGDVIGGRARKWSYELGAMVIAGIYMVCSLAVFFGVKEKRVADESTTRLWDGFREVLTFRPYLILSVAALFNYLAITVVQGNMALFYTHSVNLGAHFPNFILALLITSVCAVPFWQKCLLRFGKKSTFAAGVLGFLPPLTASIFVKDNVYVYYVGMVLAGIALSAMLFLPWSMLPDALDEFYLKTGKRKDALFYSFFVFFLKLASGMGLGLSQAALAVGGYKTGACIQPESVGLTLRLLVGPGPILFFLLCLLFLYLYPINEERRKHNKKKLDMRYKNIVAGETDMPPLMDESSHIIDSAETPDEVTATVSLATLSKNSSF